MQGFQFSKNISFQILTEDYHNDFTVYFFSRPLPSVKKYICFLNIVSHFLGAAEFSLYLSQELQYNFYVNIHINFCGAT